MTSWVQVSPDVENFWDRTEKFWRQRGVEMRFQCQHCPRLKLQNAVQALVHFHTVHPDLSRELQDEL